MKAKFSSLLNSETCWAVEWNNRRFDSRIIKSIIAKNINSWKNIKHEFFKNKYYLVVGDNSLEYLTYVFLASCLGIKIILISRKQIEYFSKNDFSDKIAGVISSGDIEIRKYANIKFDFYLDEKRLITKQSEVIEVDGNIEAELVFCTSGTTSEFKMARYRESRLYKNASVVSDYLGLSKDDVCLCMFPFSYMYGFSCTFSTLIRGGRVIFERPTLPALGIIEYIQAENITLLPIVASIVDKLSPHLAGLYFSNLKVINASDKIYVKHADEILRFSPVFWNNMGQTESGPRLFSLKIKSKNRGRLDKLSYNNVIALGRPVDKGVQVKIVNKAGIECAKGEVGELFYNTIFSMEGYLNLFEDKLHLSPIWRSSGDLVFEGEQGMVYWVGRKSQLLKVNGIFVNVNLLHRYFDELPYVDSSFFTINEKINEINAYFIIDWKIISDEQAVRSMINSLYAKNFKLYPRISNLYFIDEFPRTESGKIEIKKLNAIASKLLKSDFIREAC